MERRDAGCRGTWLQTRETLWGIDRSRGCRRSNNASKVYPLRRDRARGRCSNRNEGVESKSLVYMDASRNRKLYCVGHTQTGHKRKGNGGRVRVVRVNANAYSKL